MCIYSTVLFHDMFSQQISASPSLNTLWFPQRSAHIHLCLGNNHKWLSSLGIGPELFQEKAPPEICASLDVRFASQVFCLVDLLQLHHIMCKHKHSQNLSWETFSLPSKSIITFTQSLSLSFARKHSAIPNVPTLLVFTRSLSFVLSRMVKFLANQDLLIPSTFFLRFHHTFCLPLVGEGLRLNKRVQDNIWT